MPAPAGPGKAERPPGPRPRANAGIDHLKFFGQIFRAGILDGENPGFKFRRLSWRHSPALDKGCAGLAGPIGVARPVRPFQRTCFLRLRRAKGALPEQAAPPAFRRGPPNEP